MPVNAHDSHRMGRGLDMEIETMKPDYITLNGRVFARNKALLTRTLFQPVQGRTACGTFRATKNSLYLHDLQGERVAFINARGVCGQASKLDNGRYLYQYGNPPILGDWPSSARKENDCNSALRDCDIERQY